MITQKNLLERKFSFPWPLTKWIRPLVAGCVWILGYSAADSSLFFLGKLFTGWHNSRLYRHQFDDFYKLSGFLHLSYFTEKSPHRTHIRSRNIKKCVTGIQKMHLIFKNSIEQEKFSRPPLPVTPILKSPLMKLGKADSCRPQSWQSEVLFLIFLQFSTERWGPYGQSLISKPVGVTGTFLNLPDLLESASVATNCMTFAPQPILAQWLLGCLLSPWIIVRWQDSQLSLRFTYIKAIICPQPPPDNTHTQSRGWMGDISFC